MALLAPLPGQPEEAHGAPAASCYRSDQLLTVVRAVAIYRGFDAAESALAALTAPQDPVPATGTANQRAEAHDGEAQ